MAHVHKNSTTLPKIAMHIVKPKRRGKIPTFTKIPPAALGNSPTIFEWRFLFRTLIVSDHFVREEKEGNIFKKFLTHSAKKAISDEKKWSHFLYRVSLSLIKAHRIF